MQIRMLLMISFEKWVDQMNAQCLLPEAAWRSW